MNIAKYTKKLLILGALIFVVAGGILGTYGLNYGIDFTGGALTEVSYEVAPEQALLEERLGAQFEEGYSLRSSVDSDGNTGYILRTRDLSEEERETVYEALTSVGEGGTVTRFASIGPVIGEELKDKASWAIAGVVLITIFYVAFAFRKVPKPVGSWTYGGITILALIHDVLVPTTVMSILGVTMGAEVDVLFVTALLAVLGYSVNDTIVVFDRVRENLLLNEEKKTGKTFETVVNESVSDTVVRSINTSLTTILALGALYFLGGATTQLFALTLIVGVLAGTYSSLFIANPLLIAASRRKKA
ncbi:protein translocase subunit SecF [Candidatus Kaiserbacteria bacterium]|nr:protein translocase subunit SecF [Candidatus Kaiserbacteria bacterium]